MVRLTAFLALLLTLLWCWRAEAAQVTGDPFVAPLPLAGTWRAMAGDMAPAEADGADIAAWHPVPVPGKWAGTELEGHQGLTWYGLDIVIEPRERPSGQELVLLLPPFLAA